MKVGSAIDAKVWDRAIPDKPSSGGVWHRAFIRVSQVHWNDQIYLDIETDSRSSTIRCECACNADDLIKALRRAKGEQT